MSNKIIHQTVNIHKQSVNPLSIIGFTLVFLGVLGVTFGMTGMLKPLFPDLPMLDYFFFSVSISLPSIIVGAILGIIGMRK